MGLFKFFFTPESKYPKLLSASIVCLGANSTVAFTEHRAGLEQSEYVQLLLHYYLDVIYRYVFFRRDDKRLSFRYLVGLMGRVLDQWLGKDTDVGLKQIEADLILFGDGLDRLKGAGHPREIAVTLYVLPVHSADDDTRDLKTSSTKQVTIGDMILSVMLLLQAVLRQVDDNSVAVLHRALQHVQTVLLPENFENFLDPGAFLAPESISDGWEPDPGVTAALAYMKAVDELSNP